MGGGNRVLLNVNTCRPAVALMARAVYSHLLVRVYQLLASVWENECW